MVRLFLNSLLFLPLGEFGNFAVQSLEDFSELGYDDRATFGELNVTRRPIILLFT